MRSPRFTTFPPVPNKLSASSASETGRSWSLDSDQPRCPAVSSTVSAYQYRRRKAVRGPSPSSLRKAEMARPSSAASACSSGPSRLGRHSSQLQSGQRDRVPCRPRRRRRSRARLPPPPPDSPGSAGAGRAGWRSTAGASSPQTLLHVPLFPQDAAGDGAAPAPVLVLEPGQGPPHAAARTALPIPDPSWPHLFSIVSSLI